MTGPNRASCAGSRQCVNLKSPIRSFGGLRASTRRAAPAGDDRTPDHPLKDVDRRVAALVERRSVRRPVLRSPLRVHALWCPVGNLQREPVKVVMGASPRPATTPCCWWRRYPRSLKCGLAGILCFAYGGCTTKLCRPGDFSLPFAPRDRRTCCCERSTAAR